MMKVEYEVTPEIAESLAVEFLALTAFKRQIRFRPVIFALVFSVAYLAFLAEGTQSHTNGRDTRIQTICELTLTAGALGWGMALYLRHRVCRLIADHIRTSPNACFGSHTFSWDEAGIGLSSHISDHHYAWLVCDEVLEGAVGVHFLWRRKRLFSIPKNVLPAEGSPSKLREMIQGQAQKDLPQRARS